VAARLGRPTYDGRWVSAVARLQGSPVEPERRRAKKRAWWGYALMGIAIVMFAAARELGSGDHPGVWSFVLVIGGLCLAIGVGRVGRRLSMDARKLDAAAAAGSLKLSSVRPVVYLRAFADDEKVADAGVAQGFFQLQTEEEQLARVLNRIAPFVAIGDPRESKPDLGATRIYVGSDKWKQRVIELLDHASLVVMRAADTQAVQWELQQSVSILAANRLLLVVPKGRRRYRAIKARCDAYLTKPLPELPRRSAGLKSVGWMVRFDPDWTPIFLPRARLRWLRGTIRAPYEQRLQYMLRPVFEQVGAEWEKPPLSLQSPAGLLGGLVILGLLYQGFVAIVGAAGG
jgi:hypothetical protein